MLALGYIDRAYSSGIFICLPTPESLHPIDRPILNCLGNVGGFEGVIPR